ncbi:hypothetical protein [Meiothermus hypogaeus]|uniref:LPS-assembly protein LptD n=1 Tax=Meiothermus hypogaeus NBRC 106114 TaxID=1227553 RepID=A0A511R3H0_9DEIN|nr:hypothetical protein [Meiothermus hypogaeus]GEM83412.1 hypothetical protein MHY01S_15780 [Meiothermus hypogaeus NBRC 106114]
MLLLLALLFSGLAWASPTSPIPCAEQPYTLETPEGLAGGGNLEFDGEVALFSDGACLQTKGLLLQAPSLRYDQASGELTARQIEVETPRYRFWAEESHIQDQVLRASGIRATTCRCGDDLRLLSKTLHFDTQTGEVVLEDSQLEVYAFGLAHFSELRLDPNQPLGDNLGLTPAGAEAPLALPVRFDFDQGLNVGLSEFPLPDAGGRSGKFSTRLTLLGLRLGSPDPILRLGLAAQEKNRRASLQLDSKSSGVASRGEVVDGPLFFVHDSEKGRYAFGLKQAFALDRFILIPYGWIAQDWRDGTPATQEQGLTAGAELRYNLEMQEGPFRFRLEPFGVLGFYNQPQQYLAYGGYAEGRYEGDFILQVGYTWAIESTPGRFWLERREATQKLSGSLRYRGLGLEAGHDFLKAQTEASLRIGLVQDYGEVWAQLHTCWNCVGKTLSNGRDDWERRELVVGFTPVPLSCTYDLNLTPFLGYDFLRQGVSRWGLELRYADCCFIWRLGYQEIRLAQHPDEVANGKLTFGLEIR